MKKQGIWALVVLGIIAVVVLAYFGVFQTIFGMSLTEAGCQAYIKNDVCSSGYYKCHPCQQVTLAYYVTIAGTKTNKVWQSECVSKGSTAGQQFSGTDFCVNNPTPHSSNACYDNDVYWYNSIGQREEKKTECGTAGCTDIHIGGSVSCNSPPPPPNPCVTQSAIGTTCPPQHVGKLCMPNTNNLCLDAIQQTDGTYLCDIDKITNCPLGCVNNACKVDKCAGVSCPDVCDTVNSYTQKTGGSCDSNTGKCIYHTITVNGCFPRQCTENNKTCAGNTPAVCTNGQWLSSTPCSSGTECINGDCIGTPPVNLCENVTCQNSSCYGTTFIPAQTCDTATGQCKQPISLPNSSNCIIPSTCGNGVCDSGETTANCPADCKATPTNIAYYILGGLVAIVIILIIVALVPKGKRKKK